MNIIVNPLSVSIYTFIFLSLITFSAYSITMKIEKDCGSPYRLEVWIKYPHGMRVPHSQEYADVSASGKVILPPPVKEGFMVKVIQKVPCDQGGCQPQTIFGSWTPAKDGGTLPVKCLSQHR